MKRKEAIKLMTAGAAATALGTPVLGNFSTNKSTSVMKLKGNINHSACRWCYNKIPMEQFLDDAKAIGLKFIRSHGQNSEIDRLQPEKDVNFTCIPI